MQKLLIAFAMLLTFSSSACAQKNKKVNKPTAVNADSVYVQQLTDKAKKGDSEAQNELGGLYYLGNKVKRDYIGSEMVESCRKKQQCSGYCQYGPMLSDWPWNKERQSHGCEVIQAKCQAWQ